jgi:hypothetical protein
MIFELHTPEQAKILMERLWPDLKTNLATGQRMRLEIKKATRSLDQNAKFHAMIGQIGALMRLAGSTWTDDDWKRLLIDQWAHETDRKIGRVAPSLDGERVVQLGWQSIKFTVEDASEFIEWLYAWAAEKNIEI